MDDVSGAQPRTALDIAAAFDLMGRHAVVVGGGSGVGLEIVRALASADATVVATMSEPDTDRPALQALQDELEGSTIRTASMDPRDLGSVRRFVMGYLSTAQPLQLLIHADQYVPTAVHRRSVDGFEETFAGYLGQFALTAGMITALRRSSAPRVLSITSAGHALADVDFADPNFAHRRYDPWLAYGQAMSANALFSVGFTAHHGAEGVCCNVIDAGGLDMLSLTTFPPAEAVDLPATRSAAAAQVTWAALAAELDGLSGAYLTDFGEAQPWRDPDPTHRPGPGYEARVMDPERALRLWDLSHLAIRGIGGW